MMRGLERLIACVAISVTTTFVATSGQLQAGVVTVSTSDNRLQAGVDNQGWLGRNGNSNPNNDSYVTNAADYQFAPYERRSYFFFDLSSVTEPINSVTLRLRRYSTITNAEIEFFDVSTSASDLVATRGTTTGNPVIFDDLGSGISYGAFNAGAGTSQDILEFKLNASAVADANAATGYFAIGAKALSLSLFGGSTSEPGLSSTNFVQELVLDTGVAAVPEPTSLVIFGFGALGLAGGAIRRRKSAMPLSVAS